MLFAKNPELEEGVTQVVTRDLVATPTMTRAIADKHREERYKHFTTIEDIVTLPTEFDRAEALYALAGRSGSGAIQALLFEADRVADHFERVQLLGILFFRLAEVDPQSALALARTDPFRNVRSFERTVWRAWARRDLDEALFAAKSQTSIVDQRLAARSLYAAFGYMGNTTTDRIEAELGIEPDRSTRGRYLYRLADESPAEAIAFINGVTDYSRKTQYVSWLANYLSLTDPEQALRYAPLLSGNSNQKQFEQILRSSIAAQSPHATIERLIASGANLQQSREFGSAIRALAKSDPEAATLYFGQIRSVDAKRNVGWAIAGELARRDPDAALAWARENELTDYPFLQMNVLQAIASDDPQRAMDMALALPNSETKSRLVSQVIQGIAHHSPTDAIAYLDEIENPRQKEAAGQQLLQTWIQTDAGAAMDWVFSQDKETRTLLLQTAQHALVDRDVETAIRILPRLDESTRNQMKRQIAERLAITASPAEALSFIRQFEAEPGYGQLQAALIAGVAHSDVYAARQLADQLPVGEARDYAYSNIISHQARANPAEATRWLENVDTPHIRGTIAGEIATAWYEIDPGAANRWVSSLPAGPLRDATIVNLAYQWRDVNSQQRAMIESISDPGLRGQAKIRQIYSLMRSNPEQVRKLLQDDDIPAQERQRIETMLARPRRIY